MHGCDTAPLKAECLWGHVNYKITVTIIHGMQLQHKSQQYQ